MHICSYCVVLISSQLEASDRVLFQKAHLCPFLNIIVAANKYAQHHMYL